MRVRTALVSLGCSLALVIAGCSSTIAGIPQGGGGTGVVNTGATNGSGGSTGGLSTPSATGGADQTGGSGGDSTGLPTDLSGLPTDLTDLTGLPTDLTDLSNIPGISDDCMAIVNAMIAIGTMFLAPTLGGTSLTQDQVDQAFKGLDSAPSDIQPAIKTLHDAANQAVGKSSTEALAILGSDAVSKAFDDLSKYSDQHCGSS